ncbi:MAG: LysM peptidoglycan-binding domain-containing protein [Chloroflexi bacterium]|nr:LysM peptidoglycan-binding domain-containing protein [Chloroflexota bacterium]
MNARDRAIYFALLVVAVLGPVFYLAGLLARGLALLQTNYFRLGFTYVTLGFSAGAAAYLLFRRGSIAVRAMAGLALLANLSSVLYASGSWMQEMQRRFLERDMVPIEPIQVGILIAPLDDEPASRQESRAIEKAVADMIRRDGLDEYVTVRHMYPISSAEQARRLGEKMRANVVVWKGRDNRYQRSADYYLTVLGANETEIALDPVPLMTLLLTHGTYRVPNQEITLEGQLPTVATEVVVPAAAGFGYMAIGRPMLAVDCFRTALSAQNLDGPTWAMLQNQLATALLLLNRDDLALEAYIESKDISANAKAWVGLGNVALARRDWTMANEAYRQAIRLDPYEPSAYCGLGILHTRERNLQAAMSAFYQAISLCPEESVPYALLGMGYELLGDVNRARDAYRVSEQYAGPNAGLHVAVAERVNMIMRNPPTAVPTATPRPLPTPTPVPPSALYHVKSGDTLGTIAEQFGVSIEDLLKVNDIKHRDAIFIGQELIIPEKD